MEELEVYSPLQDLSVRAGNYVLLVSAINHALELADNEERSYGRIRKTISIKRIADVHKPLMKYKDPSFK